ncbi:hypothetical protein Y032_0049g1785 [Ancylostoma ceylanicum]|uniref:Uncharacterized protein n=1 Tax=Ancylostoma ceylanicum TaxID=53326 RepID=A0A016U9G3_9BILA|nr:hypothetical protein Y032_0049g1785 [Ancylostoma ceylanicum]
MCRFLILSRFLRSEHFCNFQFPTLPQYCCINIDSQLEFILYKRVLKTKLPAPPPSRGFIISSENSNSAEDLFQTI